MLEAGGASLSPDTVALLCANIFMLDGKYRIMSVLKLIEVLKVKNIVFVV